MPKRQNRTQAPSAEPDTKPPTRHIPDKETLRLWVASGGRCERCNKYLLEEDKTELPINLSQRAHIAGWKVAPGSPHGGSTLPERDRNTADNLMLLCYECHKLVDDQETRHLFPEELLLTLKQEHEERIFHLTAMGRDRETAVLRVFGSIRGAMPDLARDEALRTIVDGAGRYARFPLALDRHSVEVNLSHLPDPETIRDETYWRLGRMEIDRLMARVVDGVRDKHIRHISIFALTRIPLLVYLGYVLDDKVPVDLYQKHRGEGEGWLWPEQESAASFQIVTHRDGAPGGDIALILSLSGTVPPTDLPDEIGTLALFEIRPIGVTPNPNLFRSRATLDSFTRTYQDLLAQLEQTHKSARTIHLFPAVPITAAVACGRHLMRDVHPALKIYDRIGNVFMPALTVNER